MFRQLLLFFGTFLNLTEEVDESYSSFSHCYILLVSSRLLSLRLPGWTRAVCILLFYFCTC